MKAQKVWIEADKLIDDVFWIHFQEPHWSDVEDEWCSPYPRPVKRLVLDLFEIRIPKPGTCVAVMINAKSVRGTLRPPKESG